mgnify:CR=1 FL=1
MARTILVVDDEPTLRETLAEALLGACLDAGGSLTGEHGVGVDKACSMPKMFSERDLEAFERLTGVAVTEQCGSTETGPYAMNPPFGRKKPGSVGPPAHGVHVASVEVDEEAAK